ncbi:50S ribosomal protein L31 [Kitasatospora sp. NPDC004669]|uniref:50S ribosomal protein L31 n=1 Tax=Kitasatospora sp. NPDC004669 TaxID=3154555 RepID=UPI0033AF2071
MKPGIHPEYRPVVFRDKAGGLTFLTRSTLTSDQSIEWEDGRTRVLGGAGWASQSRSGGATVVVAGAMAHLRALMTGHYTSAPLSTRRGNVR